MAMKVNAEVIDRLFKRLGAVYGASWDRSLGLTPMADVKTLWGEYLSGFDVDDVAYALDKMTERTPNIMQFRDLCRAAPKKDVLRLERPMADPLKVAEEIAKQAKVKEAINVKRWNPKAWAQIVIARADAGEKVSPTVLKMAKDTANGWQP